MKLVKILPDKIQIRTDDAEFANARLNDLISVSDGEVELVTMITAITDNDVETQMDDNVIIEELKQPSLKVIECSILGSVIDGEFKQQIDRYPSTDVEIKKISQTALYFMLAPDKKENIFEIGTYAGYGTRARIDGNKFYQRHSCIVGNTGCGKSETVTKIIEETAKLPGTNLVIFDIHGEYSQLSYVDSIKMGEVPFPIWMLGFADMATNVLKVKEDSTVVMSALRKAYYEQCPNGNEGKPIYFHFEKMMEFIKGLNDEYIDTGETYKSGEKAGQPKYIKGDLNGKLSGIVNAMETVYTDRRLSFIFAHKGQLYLKMFLERIMGGDKPVKNIDLSGIPHDIAVLIIGAITKLIYNIQIMQKDAGPITLVCDEAHVYIPTDFQLTAAQRRMIEIFENIAKEGRKFGITLFVASQRPSELNKTIMAQCANYIIMKLNNENDKSMIKGMMPAGSADVIETTTMFSSGDCLVVGDACAIPLKIHVELAKERPQSKTIDFWTEWGKERDSVDYAACLEEYLEN